MKKYTNFYGIDVSKDTFDVMDAQGKHSQFSNNSAGFKKFLKELKNTDLCVLEVTGVYHLLLSNYLYSNNIPVSVENPLRIKRFSQMHLKRNKTDKADAKMICLYAQNQEVTLYRPKEKALIDAKDCFQVMEQFINMKSDLKRKLSGLNSKKATTFIIEEVESQIVNLEERIAKIEHKIENLLKSSYQEMVSLLCSISGIGKRTAALLIIETEGFESFNSASQLRSFFGVAPTERSSGTSINGGRRISKMGNPLVRKKLYMCSLQASVYNKACKQLYNRLIEKGKAKKLALIAVVNKLLKICFAVVKNKIKYDADYRSVLS